MSQKRDDQSVLARLSGGAGLAQAHPALVGGSIRFLDAEGDVLAFIREGGGERLLCVFNFSDRPVSWSLPPGLGRVEAVDFAGNGAALRDGTLALPGLHGFIGRLA